MKSPVARSNNARTNEHKREAILRRAVGSSDQSTKPQPRNRTKKPGITHKKKVNVPEKERNRGLRVLSQCSRAAASREDEEGVSSILTWSGAAQSGGGVSWLLHLIDEFLATMASLGLGWRGKEWEARKGNEAEGRGGMGKRSRWAW
jgi:hypothetical protein